MEERDLSGVERELRGYLCAQLDRLPVRSTPRFSSPPRGWLRTATFVPATLLTILIAVAAGLGLADWRAHRTPSDPSPVAAGGIPGPLALGGGAPSLGFGLVSTSANTLLVRNETTTSSPMTISDALPQVAVSPNGHEIAYWLALPSGYQLTRADLIVNGSAPGIGSPTGALMRAPGNEVPGPVIWSSDGTGLIANTHSPALRGPVVGIPSPPPMHASWFTVDAATGKATELAPDFASVVSTVYAWDRQRDLVTGSGFNGGRTTFTTLRGGRISNTAVPNGWFLAAADAYARSVVVVSRGECPGPRREGTLCPLLEIRDQETFVKSSIWQALEPATDYLEVTFRPRSQDLIVQIPLPNGDARVELWSDLGRGPHHELALYSQSGRFTARRERILSRADGSAVFLLKFDDSAGGRWFGELVSLALPSVFNPPRTPFEIRTGGNPLASVVLDPAFARAMEAPASAVAPSRTPSGSTATQGSRSGPISTEDIVTRLSNAGMRSRILPPVPSRLLLYNATGIDHIAVDQPRINAFVVYRYPTIAAATAAFGLEAVQDPARSTISYVARPYFVGLGDTLVVFATDDEATAERVIAALIHP